MNIHIHFFNVQDGDSIVLEIEHTPPLFIVIDSNLVSKKGEWINPAYEFLKAKKAKFITLIITHLHLDHCNGVELFLENFLIDKLIIPPLFNRKSSIRRTVINEYKDKIRDVLGKTNDKFIYKQLKSIALLLKFLAENGEKVEEIEGKENKLRFARIPDLDCCVYLPIPKIKGEFYSKVFSGDFEIDFFPTMNDLSLAFSIKFPDFQVLFTGDSTSSQWLEHERQMHRDGINNLNCTFVKIPHHGSKYDNKERFYNYILREKYTGKHVFISADGVKHPHKEIFDIISKKSLQPHCTNFSEYCLPPDFSDDQKFSEIPKEMHSFLINYKRTRKIMPCKGNIKLSIYEDGKRQSVSNSQNMTCIYTQKVEK